MAQLQEEGWPLGLQLVNMRTGVSGSMSFSTLLTSSPGSSIASSSELDTESTRSFFHDNDITLGSLIGASSILELSRKSTRGRSREESTSLRSKPSSRFRGWFSSLCSTTESADTIPSLGHFLEVERRASNDQKSDQSTAVYDQTTVSKDDLKFNNGPVAPQANRSSGLAVRCGVPMLCSCIYGQATK